MSGKILHYVITVDEDNNIELDIDTTNSKFPDGNVYDDNADSGEWEQPKGELEDRDVNLCAHLQNVFKNHNEIFGDGQELSVD